MLGTRACATRPGLGAGTGLPVRRTRGSAGWPTAGREHGQAQGGQGSSTASIHLGHGPWPLSLRSSLQGRKERCPYNLVLDGVSAFPLVLSHPTCVTLSVIPNLDMSPLHLRPFRRHGGHTKPCFPARMKHGSNRPNLGEQGADQLRVTSQPLRNLRGWGRPELQAAWPEGDPVSQRNSLTKVGPSSRSPFRPSQPGSNWLPWCSGSCITITPKLGGRKLPQVLRVGISDRAQKRCVPAEGSTASPCSNRCLLD